MPKYQTKPPPGEFPSAKSHQILIGPAGWSYPDWNGIVYPLRRPRGFHEASYLAQYFDTIEINTSFYSPLNPDHARQWTERVAANPRFRFTAKLWQKFTHEEQATAADEATVRLGLDILRGAGRLGALLMQFPFSFHNTPRNLARIEKLLDSLGDYPLVVEVRHSSWAHPEFYEFLHERRAGICNIDQPLIGRSMGPDERATSPLGYVRLHGRRADTWFSDDPELPSHQRYNYLYSRRELEPWARRIRLIRDKTETTFVIANNHFEGKAVVNALELMHALSGNKVKVPEPLRHRFPSLEEIADAPSEEPTLFPLSSDDAPGR
jgi:uncharacterized protein YecE (DUF72 family)